jgi:hypothetical protein
VEADGRIYDEPHVDSRATAQVYVYTAGVDWEHVLEKLEVPDMPDLYVIRKSMFEPKNETVKNKIFDITGRSVSSMIRPHGLGNVCEIYLMGIRNGLDFNMAYIPGTLEEEPKEAFDPVYMKKLFNLAYEQAKGGCPWEEVPPGHDAEAEED